MNTLQRRLEALEMEAGDRLRIVWIEPGETRDEALRRAGVLAAGEAPVFVGWQGGVVS